MNRRRFLAGGAAAPLLAQRRERPSFIFILSDDHHYQCLGAAGNPHIRTPHLDRLASRGAIFTNAAISTPQCAPSRGVLLSGLETFQSGLRSNGARGFREGIGPLVIEQLRRSGYQTGLVGKWHIAGRPAACGFSHAPLWLPAGSSRYLDPMLCRGLDGSPRREPGHITDLFTAAAVDFVRSARRPYFLWLAYNAPHTPWQAGETYRRLYHGKTPAEIAPPAHPRDAGPFDWPTYYAVITHLDEAIGRLVSELETTGAWSNTVLCFLGDNGYLCGARGLNGKVHPWEPSVRVPFLAAGGPVANGLRTAAPAASIDLPATWLDMAGVPPAYRLAGSSLRNLLTTGKGGPEEGFAVWDDGRPEALSIHVAVEPYRQVRTGRHKLTVWESGRQALYDHVADPREERDLLSDPAHARTLADLRRRLEARMRATGDTAAPWLRSATP